VAEVAALKIADIDSERMLIRVERGKGGRYRIAMLPADLLTLLREWWTAGYQLGVMHRGGWLFPGQHAMNPISTRQLHRIVVEAAQAAEITKRVGPHTLRHSFLARQPFVPRTVLMRHHSRQRPARTFAPMRTTPFGMLNKTLRLKERLGPGVTPVEAVIADQVFMEMPRRQTAVAGPV
jgi:integrase